MLLLRFKALILRVLDYLAGDSAELILCMLRQSSLWTLQFLETRWSGESTNPSLPENYEQ